MDKDLKQLSDTAMSLLMQQKAKTHGCCFTQKEFEENISTIFSITGAKQRLEKKLKDNNG